MAGSDRDHQGVVALLPLMGAIFVFGTIYGATQVPLAGVGRTVMASVLIFSGVAQFTAAALLAAGMSAAGIVATVAVVNVRHVFLGAALRQRLAASTGARLGLAFLLVDESVGVGLASRGAVRRRYVQAGLACYGAWVAGTTVGATGGAALGSPLVAEAVFPVLFVGLAAVTAQTRSRLALAVLAMPVTVGLVLLVPALEPLAPLAAALAVALLAVRR